MKKLLILILSVLLICPNTKAQDKTRKERKGDKFSFSYAFDKAIDTYSHTKNLSLESRRKLAESYHKMDRNIESEIEYEKIVKATAGVLPEDYFNYAMVLKMNGKQVESNLQMQKFAALSSTDLRAKDYLTHKSDFGNLQIDKGIYRITHLDINTKALEFGPSYYQNKVVFASTRAKQKLFAKKYNWTHSPFWDMYVADIDGNQLKNPVIFEKQLNGNLHDGPASFSKDGSYMAFTRNHYKDKSKDGVVELQLFFTHYKDGKWSEIESFAYNNEAYSVGQPCLSADGKTIYFTSDMPGGYGKADIYRSVKNEKNEWGKPINLGDKINTEGDEMFPFFDETNQTLYFSSNGRFGLGGLDIFSSHLKGLEFDDATNIGFPMNTPFDDFAAIVDGKVNRGYFTSNRSGGSGGDDLFSFEILTEPTILFFLKAPLDAPVIRRIRETFPVRNYVFFTAKSTEIPDRYVLLTRKQVKYFKEDQLDVFIPKHQVGRSKRQMNVYYNVLNILGDRMGRNPSAKITLVGSSTDGPAEARAMAESVKKYLTDIFAIKPTRIAIEGLTKPKIPSEHPGGTRELELLRQGNQRVSIESNSPAILMEFQSGPEAPLKPIEILTEEKSPIIDTSLTVNMGGAKQYLTSWSIDIRDEMGKVQHFGSYTTDQVSIPVQSILGIRPEADYEVTMIGQTKAGRTITKTAPVHLVLYIKPKIEELTRFSIIFEFDNSRAISIYEKYLTDIITPKIPKGGKVVIHGYTDVIGFEDHNLKLSQNRANDAQQIIEASLAKAGRTDVTFDVKGYGEDENTAPFENKYPEERFYNRTVIIEIMSSSK
jgi:outer membrane protein OmpA-like peptidoglycan-associated protein